MKVLILYNKLWHYRIPVFNILANKYDLSVAYSFGEAKKENYNFNIIKFPVWKWGRYVWHKTNLAKFCSSYDVVIAYGVTSWISLMKLGFIKRNFSLIYWSIGVRASYNTKYNARTFWDLIRFYFFSKADALIFYSDAPISRYLSHGFNKNKLFVANNTVDVKDIGNVSIIKDRIIFVGTIYKQKGIQELLKSFKEAKAIVKNVPKLHIIGGGHGLSDVKDFIVKNNLCESIIVHGPVYDENELAEHFMHSFACISPNQAGLSVLKSLGYGVPFVTKKNAITGGEIFNIQNNFNGITYEKPSDLTKVLIDINNNPEKFAIMGQNAYKYYQSYRTITNMAEGIINAIQYTVENKKKL